jgi:hypothetical protein
MEKNKAIELIFAEWKASLKSRDRSQKSVRPNFEELFQRWKDTESSFDELYENWLPKAIKAHQPVASVARNSYKKFKQIIPRFDKTEKEFLEEWNQSIEDTATEAFFDFFPAPRLDEDNEPKVYGNMSAKEYRAQRRYAEQFPVLDTTELEKRWQDQQYNLDIEDLLKNVLGSDKDETNA